MNNANNELHVIFGTGPVGLTLADELIARGRRVRLVNRSGKAETSQDVEIVAADATDPAAVTALSEGAVAIYNCVNSVYSQQYEMVPRFQKAILAAASVTGAKLIVTDSLYMYGVTHGVPMNEDTPYAPSSRKGEMRAQVARDYLKAHADGVAQVALGRAADFFGPRVFNSTFGERVFPLALSGQPVQVMGNIDLPHPYSYMPDIARGLATLGERPEAIGHEWLLPVAPTVTTREMLKLVEAAVGHPLEIQTATREIIEHFGEFDEQMREFVEMFYQYEEPQIVDSSRFTETFEWSATPLSEAIAATVDWFKALQK
ncbi:MAG: NAD-dependent epimerase/dehydratase family protein [Capsulimonas sp.]|uniref:NAD-dependent epimerase/dehydratase family protein n=1 Tax=Capsulimonas sp. TaxID=2494211 RepID=UPI003267209E